MLHVLAMGKYAAYVWPAYGVSILGIGATIVWTLRSYGRAKRRLSEIENDGGS
jgi:heme exporter protein CcmD